MDSVALPSIASTLIGVPNKRLGLTTTSPDAKTQREGTQVSSHSLNHLPVIFICNSELLKHGDNPVVNKDRLRYLWDLASNYDLLEKLSIVSPQPASFEDLIQFHSSEYVNALRYFSIDQYAALGPSLTMEVLAAFGLVEPDCAPFPGLYEHASWVGGASITAARLLCEDAARVAINFSGGRHHAKRDMAGGYCFVGDIPLAIFELRKRFKRVMYIDVDVHHGDGVEETFERDPSVMTISLHKYGQGFYPTTGALKDVGTGPGKYTSVNVPLHDGMDDDSYWTVFTAVVDASFNQFKPGAIVIQCGTDTLTKDPIGTFSLSVYGLAKCIDYVMRLPVHVLALGGGGYSNPNAARLWTQILAFATESAPLPVDIPEHQRFMEYSPNFMLQVEPCLSEVNHNTETYLNSITSKIVSRLKRLPNFEKYE
ncbi:hypothetical protein GEMRC1_001934 [Eukaryota sp. GEM-RC1]